jgi:hypothetical protein
MLGSSALLCLEISTAWNVVLIIEELKGHQSWSEMSGDLRDLNAEILVREN